VVGNRLQGKILSSVGETDTEPGRIFHLLISAVAVLLCRCKTGTSFTQTTFTTLILHPALEYPLFVTL